MVMEGIEEDGGEGNMVCTNHPYKNSAPGGICAFCLQEKLGKLVSSSFPTSIFPSSSSSSTPSFRSDFVGPNTNTNNIGSSSSNTSRKGSEYHQFDSIRKSRMPFLLSQRRKKKAINGGVSVSGSESAGAVFKRSMSTATPRNRLNFLEAEGGGGGEHTPHRRGFWSFLYSSSSSFSKKSGKDSSFTSSSTSRERKREDSVVVVVEENGESSDDVDDNQSAVDRKVSRSRSVGCGSRSFSGDLFERISTGFGDCTLRRVESQREGKNKAVGSTTHHRASGASGQDCIKERVRCGGIFSGFIITSSSSSSSTTSSSSSSSMASVGPHHNHLAHGRSRSWGWAFASPMRAFTKPSNGKRESSSSNNKNTTLLSARG